MNNIGAEGATKISESLMTNTTLIILDLHCDDIYIYIYIIRYNKINENDNNTRIINDKIMKMNR